MSEPSRFTLDGCTIPFQDGQTIMAAALAAGVYIPHLCFNPEFPPHGSCRVCLVKVNGRMLASCTTPAAAGQVAKRAEKVSKAAWGGALGGHAAHEIALLAYLFGYGGLQRVARKAGKVVIRKVFEL